MSGPTREEVGVAETAALQNGRNARKMLEAVEPLLRARHVREAVEGLSELALVRLRALDYDDSDEAIREILLEELAWRGPR